MNFFLAAKVKQNWFLFSLLAVLFVGIVFPTQCAAVASAIPKNWVIAVVLFLMALPLSFAAMWQTVRQPGPAVLAIAVNSLVVPLLAWPTSRLLNDDLAAGLLIAAAVPCTIASATVWTRLAGGNEAVSMLVTVVTNLCCFLITPAWIWILLGRASQTAPFAAMATELLKIVVLPIVVAQMAHRLKPVARFATATKPLLSTLAQLGLLSIVLLGAIHCGHQLAALDGRLISMVGQLALMIVIVAGVHLLAWYFGFSMSKKLGFSHADGLAVGMAGSQKTLMVGLAIALDFGGLTILPLVAYHVEQLVIDTVLAERYRLKEEFTPDVLSHIVKSSVD